VDHEPHVEKQKIEEISLLNGIEPDSQNMKIMINGCM